MEETRGQRQQKRVVWRHGVPRTGTVRTETNPVHRGEERFHTALDKTAVHERPSAGVRSFFFPREFMKRTGSTRQKAAKRKKFSVYHLKATEEAQAPHGSDGKEAGTVSKAGRKGRGILFLQGTLGSLQHLRRQTAKELRSARSMISGIFRLFKANKVEVYFTETPSRRDQTGSRRHVESKTRVLQVLPHQNGKPPDSGTSRSGVRAGRDPPSCMSVWTGRKVPSRPLLTQQDIRIRSLPPAG